MVSPILTILPIGLLKVITVAFAGPVNTMYGIMKRIASYFPGQTTLFDASNLRDLFTPKSGRDLSKYSLS